MPLFSVGESAEEQGASLRLQRSCIGEWLRKRGDVPPAQSVLGAQFALRRSSEVIASHEVQIRAVSEEGVVTERAHEVRAAHCLPLHAGGRFGHAPAIRTAGLRLLENECRHCSHIHHSVAAGVTQRPSLR